MRTADCVLGLARVHLAAGRAEAALALLQPLEAAWQAVHPGSDGHGVALHWLARAEALRGDLKSAQVHRQAALVLLRASRLPALQSLAQQAAA